MAISGRERDNMATNRCYTPCQGTSRKGTSGCTGGTSREMRRRPHRGSTRPCRGAVGRLRRLACRAGCTVHGRQAGRGRRAAGLAWPSPSHGGLHKGGERGGRERKERALATGGEGEGEGEERDSSGVGSAMGGCRSSAARPRRGRGCGVRERSEGGSPRSDWRRCRRATAMAVVVRVERA